MSLFSRDGPPDSTGHPLELVSTTSLPSSSRSPAGSWGTSARRRSSRQRPSPTSTGTRSRCSTVRPRGQPLPRQTAPFADARSPGKAELLQTKEPQRRPSTCFLPALEGQPSPLRDDPLRLFGTFITVVLLSGLRRAARIAPDVPTYGARAPLRRPDWSWRRSPPFVPSPCVTRCSGRTSRSK